MNLDKSQKKLLLACILFGSISNLLFGGNMIDDISKVSLIVCNQYGNLIEKPVYNTSVNPGDYHSVVELSKSNNFYVVTLLVNGKIYSKKLLLNN